MQDDRALYSAKPRQHITLSLHWLKKYLNKYNKEKSFFSREPKALAQLKKILVDLTQNSTEKENDEAEMLSPETLDQIKNLINDALSNSSTLDKLSKKILSKMQVEVNRTIFPTPNFISEEIIYAIHAPSATHKLVAYVTRENNIVIDEYQDNQKKTSQFIPFDLFNNFFGHDKQIKTLPDFKGKLAFSSDGQQLYLLFFTESYTPSLSKYTLIKHELESGENKEIARLKINNRAKLNDTTLKVLPNGHLLLNEPTWGTISNPVWKQGSQYANHYTFNQLIFKVDGSYSFYLYSRMYECGGKLVSCDSHESQVLFKLYAYNSDQDSYNVIEEKKLPRLTGDLCQHYIYVPKTDIACIIGCDKITAIHLASNKETTVSFSHYLDFLYATLSPQSTYLGLPWRSNTSERSTIAILNPASLKCLGKFNINGSCSSLIFTEDESELIALNTKGEIEIFYLRNMEFQIIEKKHQKLAILLKENSQQTLEFLLKNFNKEELLALMQTHRKAIIPLALGELFARNEQYESAIEQYQMAITLDEQVESSFTLFRNKPSTSIISYKAFHELSLLAKAKHYVSAIKAVSAYWQQGKFLTKNHSNAADLFLDAIDSYNRQLPRNYLVLADLNYYLGSLYQQEFSEQNRYDDLIAKTYYQAALHYRKNGDEDSNNKAIMMLETLNKNGNLKAQTWLAELGVRSIHLEVKGGIN